LSEGKFEFDGLLNVIADVIIEEIELNKEKAGDQSSALRRLAAL